MVFPLMVAYSLISSPIAPDKAAHFGVSYAMTHICQVAVKKAFDMSKTKSTIICAASVLAAGATKEVMDPYTGGTKDGRDMIANILGVGFAVTIINLDF